MKEGIMHRSGRRTQTEGPACAKGLRQKMKLVFQGKKWRWLMHDQDLGERRELKRWRGREWPGSRVLKPVQELFFFSPKCNRETFLRFLNRKGI